MLGVRCRVNDIAVFLNYLLTLCLIPPGSNASDLPWFSAESSDPSLNYCFCLVLPIGRTFRPFCVFFHMIVSRLFSLISNNRNLLVDRRSVALVTLVRRELGVGILSAQKEGPKKGRGW
ncbi:hypothetical protein GGI35DRAFT_438081 [Trichoderma velutinum]